MAFTTTFTTDATVKADVQRALHLANANDLPPIWDGIVSKSRVRAYGDIVSGLVGRGFTYTVIAAWDRGAEFERDLALWWALNEGAALGAYPDKILDKLDRRPELATVIVTNTEGGVPVLKGSGQIGRGALDDSDSIFKRQSPGGVVDETQW